MSILFSFVYANFSTLMPDSYRILWLVGPAGIYVCLTLSRLKLNNKSLFVLFFLIYLVVHAFAMSVIHGLYLGSASFLTWGAWVGLGLIYGSLKSKFKIDNIFIIIFFFVGLIHGGVICFEAIFKVTILKITSVEGVERYYGIGESISQTGLQIGCGLICCLHLCFVAKKKFIVILFFTFCVMLLAIVLTGSRSSIIFTSISIFLYLALQGKKSFASFYIIIILLLIVIYFAITQFANLGIISSDIVRFLKLAGTSEDLGNVVRFIRWKSGIIETITNPTLFLFGHGSGSSVTIPNLENQVTITHESSIIKMFYELGLLGVIFYFAILLVILKENVLRRNNFLAIDRGYKLFIVLFILIFFATCVHDMMVSWVISFYVWFCLAKLLTYPSKYP